MSADQETVSADQPVAFPRTRTAAWEEFRPRAVLYAARRNGIRPTRTDGGRWTSDARLFGNFS